MAGISQRTGFKISDEYVDRNSVQKYFCGMREERSKDDNNELGSQGYTENWEPHGQHAENFIVNDRCQNEERNAEEANQYHRFPLGDYKHRPADADNRCGERDKQIVLTVGY